jgi:coenzyme F420 hydrogenase subunit beta
MDYEFEEPKLQKECPPRCNLCYEICPGKDIPIPDLERLAFGRQRDTGEEFIGVSQDLIKGYATDIGSRNAGSSGGVASALLIYALENDIIDAAIVSGMSKEKPWRFEPKIAINREQVLAAARSKYILIPTNAILGEALEKGFKRLGVVGLPCHMHAIRKMQMHGMPKKTVNSIKFCIGLMCAINYDYRGTEHLIEEVCGVPLDQVAGLEYRAGAYPGLFTVITRDGKEVAITDNERRFHTIGFQHNRCMMCYDYTAVVADITVGDDFDPAMKRGVAGWTAMIVRSDVGKNLVNDAQAAKYIHTEPIKKENFFQGGFEWKKHGGAYHITERKRHGWPTPDYHMPINYPVPLHREMFLNHPHLIG